LERAARALAQKGVLVVENVVTPQDVSNVPDEVLGLAAASPRWLKSHPTQNGFFHNFLRTMVRKLNDDARIQSLAAVFCRPEMSKLSRGELGAMPAQYAGPSLFAAQ